jgi:hypothetical protein
MNYYSEAGQDVLLKKFFDLEGIEKGFFLDVGSTDGIFISNTYLLEQNEWKFRINGIERTLRRPKGLNAIANETFDAAVFDADL